MLVAAVAALPAFASGCSDPRSYGAKPGTFTPYDLYWEENTKGVQQAIAAAAGRGCVALDGGDYVTADIQLPSNVDFRLLEGSRLVTAVNHTKSALLHAYNATNVTVSGGGTFYGNAELFIAYFQPDPDNRFEPSKDDGSRPRTLLFERSTDIVLRDFSIRNASDWNLQIRGCSRVLVDGVDIRGSRQFPNNDGIDPDSSTDVTIINSNIDVADDGICPKATAGYGPLRNLVVRNCTVRSKSHALKFGTNTDTHMSDILFDSLTIRDSNSGMAIQQRSAGDIVNVTFSNIQIETRYVAPRWWGNGEWVSVTSEPRNKGDVVGGVRDLRFINITARAENGGLISGLARGVQGVLLDNVTVTIAAWTNYSADGVKLCNDGLLPVACRGTRDHRPALTHSGRYERAPGKADGVYFENATDVELKNVAVTFEGPSGSARPRWYGECVGSDPKTGPIAGIGEVVCVNGG